MGSIRSIFHFAAIPKTEEDFQESKPFNMCQQTQQEAHVFPQRGDFMPADFQSNSTSMISSDGVGLYLPLPEQQPSSPATEFVTTVNSSQLADGNLQINSNLCDTSCDSCLDSFHCNLWYLPETVVPTLNQADELKTFNVINSQFGHGEKSSVAFAKNGNRRELYFCQVPGCRKTYEETLDLKRHLQWHSDGHPFVCILCSYKRFQGLDCQF